MSIVSLFVAQNNRVHRNPSDPTGAGMDCRVGLPASSQ
jgi:hypothetical protein